MLVCNINFKYDQLYPGYNTSYLCFPYPLPAMWRYRPKDLCFYKVLRHAMFNQLYKAVVSNCWDRGDRSVMGIKSHLAVDWITNYADPIVDQYTPVDYIQWLDTKGYQAVRAHLLEITFSVLYTRHHTPAYTMINKSVYCVPERYSGNFNRQLVRELKSSSSHKRTNDVKP